MQTGQRWSRGRQHHRNWHLPSPISVSANGGNIDIPAGISTLGAISLDVWNGNIVTGDLSGPLLATSRYVSASAHWQWLHDRQISVGAVTGTGYYAYESNLSADGSVTLASFSIPILPEAADTWSFHRATLHRCQRDQPCPGLMANNLSLAAYAPSGSDAIQLSTTPVMAPERDLKRWKWQGQRGVDRHHQFDDSLFRHLRVRRPSTYRPHPTSSR